LATSKINVDNILKVRSCTNELDPRRSIFEALLLGKHIGSELIYNDIL